MTTLKSASSNRSLINKFALVMLLFVILELILVCDQVQPVKAIKKKILKKKLKKLLPLFALIKPKKKIILLPIPIPMKGPRYPPNGPQGPLAHSDNAQYSAPMTMAANNPLASPTNEAMMGFMTNSMPAIIRMLPTNGNTSSALAATTMTMTIHSPTDPATNSNVADAMALSNAMQAALKQAPPVSSNSQNLAAGDNYYNSPWTNSRAPLASPAKLLHNARNNFHQHQQLHQQHHIQNNHNANNYNNNKHQKRILPAPGHQQRKPSRAQKALGELFSNGQQQASPPMQPIIASIQQTTIGSHEIEEFMQNSAQLNALNNHPHLQQQQLNNLNDAFEQVQLNNNSNNYDANDDFVNIVDNMPTVSPPSQPQTLGQVKSQQPLPIVPQVQSQLPLVLPQQQSNLQTKSQTQQTRKSPAAAANGEWIHLAECNLILIHHQ